MVKHRSHDYPALISRWRSVAKASGLRLQKVAESCGYSVYCLQTRNRSKGGLYASAGVHGDEPGGTEGLIAWAEEHVPKLAKEGRLPLTLLPCVNPWGLVNNRRSDEDDQDYNRSFDRDDLSPVAEMKRLIAGRRYDISLHLHEDYDAQGIYLYELTADAKPWGRDLLEACSKAVPIDTRRRIDARIFNQGLWLRRRIREAPLFPEARFLFPKHCPRAITFETPSELALLERTRAQFLLLEECTRRLLASGYPPQGS